MSSYVVEALEQRLLFTVGSPFTVPVDPTQTTDISASWQFALNPTGSPQTPGFNTSTWTTVDLPYTWDANPSSTTTGNGWYRKTLTIPASMIGDEIYLQFLGADLSTTVYVDGINVGTQNGGWEAFDVDVTQEMTAGTHLVAVDVNNTTNSNLVPAGGGDYTKQGGLYRTVSLMAVSKAHVALTEPVIAPDTSGDQVAGSGVYFSNSTVTLGISSANIQVQTVLDNFSSSSAPLTVTSYLVDANGVIQAQQSSTLTLAAGQKDDAVTQSAAVANPHLWDGLVNPYLYDLYVQVTNTTTGALLDVNHQQVGIRSFNLTANNGFFLDGESYQLVGVDLHQDSGAPGLNGGQAGWAQTDAQQQSDINMVLGVGATMIRTSHYQRDPAFYDYADQKGLIIETEIGINDNVTSTTAGSEFANNAEDMLTELIRQNYNHPSIVFWSMYNEIGNSTANATFISTLSSLAHTLDATGRITMAETDDFTATAGINTATNAVNYHPYNGWYSGDPAAIESEMAAIHAAEPNEPIGVGEFGAGASDYQYTTSLVIPWSSSTYGTTSVYHPENEQTTVEEEQYAALTSQTYLFDDIAWDMFDFSSSVRNEGDTAGINDKGLVTRNRENDKDSYYFYEANWNNPTSTRGYDTTPVIWISDHDWTDRDESSTVPFTVFSNVGAPILTLNGGAAVTLTPQVLDGMTIPDAYTTSSGNIALLPGNNNIQVSGSANGHTYTNSDVWTYHAAALAGTPYANVEFTTTAGNVQSGYSADTGAAFGLQSDGSTYGWIAPVAEVDTFTPSGTITTGDIDSITVPNGGQIQYTVGLTTTAAAIVAGLVTAWNADPAVTALGAAAETAAGTITITAASAGVSMGLTSAVDGVGTLTKVVSTAASNNPTANTSGTYDRTTVTTAPFNTLSAQTGIVLKPGNVWEYQLPDGVYDLNIVGADSSTSNLVDNLSVNGATLHATSVSTSGGTFQEFYDTVIVTNGLLSITGGPGMVVSVSGVPTTQGRLSSIQINLISNATTTALISSAISPAVGQSVTFTATVTAASGSDETGSVQFVIDGSDAGGPANLIAGAAAYTAASLTAGSHWVVAIYSGDPNFTGSSSSTFTQVVGQPATPIIAWTGPGGAMTYGQALSAAQLNATATWNGATVAGTFVYTPGLGFVPPAGQDYPLSVTFTPTDTVDDNSVTVANTVNVDPTTPIITWSNPADIADGIALSATQLDATAAIGGTAIPGTFAYSPSAGTVLPVGPQQTLAVVFTPSDTDEYGVEEQTAAINVDYGPAAKLAFVQQPTSVEGGATLSPAVTVAIEDAAGNTIPTNTSTVTLTLNGGTFNGGVPTATATAVGGIATFASLVLAASGNYTLTATDGQLASAVSNTFSVSVATSAYVNFNAAATNLTSLFTQTENANGASTAGGSDFTWESNAGITDSNGGTGAGGGVLMTSTAPADESSIYTPATFNLSDGNVHTLSEFVTATPVGGKILQIGFITSKTVGFNDDYSFISARVYGTYSSEIQYNNGGATPTEVGTTAVPAGVNTGDWLQLILTIQESASGSFKGTFSLDDYGPSGTAAPTVITAPVAYSITGLTTIGTATAMYAGWRTGISGAPTSPAQLKYDNFAVDYLAAPVLAAASDTGASNSDDLTNLNNSAPADALQFAVPSVTPGATVTLSADGVSVGSAIAAGDTVTVTTNGAATLADGQHTFTVTESFGGVRGPTSAALPVTIDTAAPTVSINPATVGTASPPISGTVNDPFALIGVLVNGNTYAATNLPNGYWLLPANTISPPLAPATYPITVTATDIAGNSVTASTSLTVLPPLSLSANTDYVKLDPDGIHTDIWTSATPTGPPSQSVLNTAISAATYAGAGGNDLVILDFSAGDPLPPSGFTFTGGAGQNTLEIIGTFANDAVTVTGSSITVNTPYGSALIAYSAATDIIFNGGAGGADTLIQAAQPGGGANLVFSDPTAQDTVAVNAGTFTLPANAPGDGPLAYDLGTVSIAPAASLVLAQSDSQADITLLNLNTPFDGGTLDITNNAMFLNSTVTTLNAVKSLVTSANNGGAWTGPGITSSDVVPTSPGGTNYSNDNDNGQKTVAYAISDPDTNAIPAGEIEVKYTILGDLNLDGAVNLTDYLILARNFNMAGAAYQNGDLNGDGTVNLTDYLLLARDFNFTLSQSGSGLSVNTDTSVASSTSASTTPIATSNTSTPTPTVQLSTAMAPVKPAGGSLRSTGPTPPSATTATRSSHADSILSPTAPVTTPPAASKKRGNGTAVPPSTIPAADALFSDTPIPSDWLDSRDSLLAQTN